jgi:aminopeptidase N
MGGGMEHQTMTTLEAFRFDLVAHELAHMWFGDNVTCATWHDIWVNEGFASYSEFLAREFLRDEENARDWMYYAHRAALASPNGSIYVPQAFVDNPIRIFNYQLSYKKGAAILHTLRFVLQDDPLFFSIMKEFQQAYADSVATADDFIKIVEVLSGEDYTNFFEQWFYGEGYPIFDVAWSYYNDTLTIISDQTTSSDATPLFQLPIEYKVQTASGDSTIRLIQDEPSEVYYLHFTDGVTGVEFDPNNWLLNEVTIQQIAGFRDSTIHMLIKPNPANEKIVLEFKEDKMEREIIITDTRGRIIKKLVSDGRSVNLNIQHWTNGFYVVSVDDGENSYTGKIIKSSTH